jgi:hypothetical protein
MGASCGTAVEKVTGKNGNLITYCFNITNSGDTYLNSIKIVDTDLNFNDNSINKLAPHESKVIAFRSAIAGDLLNTAVVTANPCLENGNDISGAEDVTDSNTSEVAHETVTGDVKQGDKIPYQPPVDKCLQNNWEAAGKPGTLICATRDVFIQSAVSDQAQKCKVGEKITVTVKASIRLTNGPKYDMGYYVSTDGGDALDGTCIVNGLQDKVDYKVVDAPGGTTVVGKVDMRVSGDGDACGDVFLTGTAGTIDMPFVMSQQLTCADDNGDGKLDMAVCFTWRGTDDNGVCDFAKNIPGKVQGGCFCTRVDVTGVTVDKPPSDPIAPC